MHKRSGFRRLPLVVLAIVVAVSALFWMVGIIWDGETQITFRIGVFDVASGAPITNARVLWVRGSPQFWEMPEEYRSPLVIVRDTTTDKHGQAEFTAPVRSYGIQNLLGIRGKIDPLREALDVSAARYQTAIVGGRVLVRDPGDAWKRSQVKATVVLHPALRPGIEVERD